MKLLSGFKKRSRADIEQEAAAELEAVVRAGQTPPPADWTLATDRAPETAASVNEN